MSEQHSATQPGPASTGVADVPKAVDATEAAKAAVVHEANEVETISEPGTLELLVVALA